MAHDAANDEAEEIVGTSQPAPLSALLAASSSSPSVPSPSPSDAIFSALTGASDRAGQGEDGGGSGGGGGGGGGGGVSGGGGGGGGGDAQRDVASGDAAAGPSFLKRHRVAPELTPVQHVDGKAAAMMHAKAMLAGGGGMAGGEAGGKASGGGFANVVNVKVTAKKLVNIAEGRRQNQR